MILSEIFKKEENLQLEKRTLVILRWIAILGQLTAILIVSFIFKFNLPILSCLIIIFFGAFTNLYLQYWFNKSELNNLESTIFLFHDLLQLSFLLFFTGGIQNPFILFLIVPSIVSSTLLTFKSTLLLTISTVLIILILTFFHYPLPFSGDLHFHVPEYYLYSIPLSIIIAMLFLTYFGARFGFVSRQKAEALSKLELIIAQEHELESIGHQAAAAAHSLGTPLSTITVVASELKKEISLNAKYSKDVDLLISQAKRCSEILKKISLNQIEEDKFISDVTLKNFLLETSKSFKEISEKEIKLDFSKSSKDILIKRTPEITYGIRNFIGNAVKFSNKKVNIDLSISKKDTVLTIKDDGPGFPSDIYSSLGQPYISSKKKDINNKSGLGLGTFIGKTLIERRGGEINFSNSNEGGAKVEIKWKTSDLEI